MISGITVKEMTKEIASTITASQADIVSVFGFGSYFRNAESYSDIDVLVVTDVNHGALVANYCIVQDRLAKLGQEVGVQFDLLQLTVSEFAVGSLNETPFLTPIVTHPNLSSMVNFSCDKKGHLVSQAP